VSHYSLSVNFVRLSSPSEAETSSKQRFKETHSCEDAANDCAHVNQKVSPRSVKHVVVDLNRRNVIHEPDSIHATCWLHRLHRPVLVARVYWELLCILTVLVWYLDFCAGLVFNFDLCDVKIVSDV
jgi:hypothetical protein